MGFSLITLFPMSIDFYYAVESVAAANMSGHSMGNLLISSSSISEHNSFPSWESYGGEHFEGKRLAQHCRLNVVER